jgi:ECF transporter S component (folate family)
MQSVKKFFAPRRLTTMALLIALQVVLARFAGIQVSEGLRVSFEAIPIIIAGIWLGPMAGFVVGLLADVIGTVISGYGVYFLPLAVTPVLNGVLPGLCFKYLWKGNMNFWKCVVMVVVTEIISSLLLGTLALTWYYDLFVPMKEGTFALLLVTRLTKVVTIAVDTLVVWMIQRSAYTKVIAPMFKERVKPAFAERR